MMGLRLQHHSLEAGGMLLIFRNWESACAHLCDHVLTWPEAEGWALILPAYSERVCVTNAQARFSLGEGTWRSKGVAVQWLYDEYAAAIKAALDIAQHQGWVWPDYNSTGDHKALGLSGVLVVFSKKAVRTAWLPGLVWSRRAAECRTAEYTSDMRQQNPLPRERADEEAVRSVLYGTLELKRYRIFRKSAKFVRSELFATSIETEGAPCGLGALRQAISEFETWAALVAAVEGDVS